MSDKNDYTYEVKEFEGLSAHADLFTEALVEIKKVVGFVLEELKESNEPIPEPNRS